jgi:2-C-methyl-D-erythritol 4-phosphate cytidylyltransferase
MSDKVGAIIVAAGSSSRIGVDKIFIDLSGRPVLAWSVAICQSSALIDRIIIVLSENKIEDGKSLVARSSWSKVVEVCKGGKRRQDSVYQGLTRLRDSDWIVIHDGARPFLTGELIKTGLEAVRETGAAIAAIPAYDTIKLSRDNRIVESTLDRKSIWLAQTPQLFRTDIIVEAYNRLNGEITDDAEAVEKIGVKVKLFEGSYRNIKLTTVEDLDLARHLAVVKT